MTERPPVPGLTPQLQALIDEFASWWSRVEKKRDAAYRSDAQTLDHSHSELGDEAEAHAGRTEQPKLNQQARYEHVVRTAPGETGRRLDRFEQRRE